MLKRIFCFLFAVGLCYAVNAQSAPSKASVYTRVISGLVIDRNGNPLPGAEVRATGGAETVYTEADGSYSIEVPITLKSLTASYAGMGSRKCKLTAGTEKTFFTLKSLNRTYGFVNVVYAGAKTIKPEPAIGMVSQAGVMGGAHRSWGGYAKIVMAVAGPTFHNIREWGNYDSNVLVNPTITGGVIKRLNPHLNLLVGAALGWVYSSWGHTEHVYGTTLDGLQVDWYGQDFYYIEDNLSLGGEVGLMYKIRRLNFIAGVTYLTPPIGFGTGSSYTEQHISHDSGFGPGKYMVDRRFYNQVQKGTLSFFVSVGLNI